MVLKRSKVRAHPLPLVCAFLLMVAIDVFCSRAALAQDEILVLAAASTTNALNEIGEIYASRNLGRINASFASSSTLAKQVESGAPADLFISADLKWMDYLDEKHLIVKESRFDLLGNKIVLIVPSDSSVKQIEVAQGVPLSDILGKEGRLAIGDPEHVPAGIYGKKALEKLGIWDFVKERLAPTKDVRAALVLVERGEAPLGLVYATDAAISQKVRVVGTFPADSHPPIIYPVAVLTGGKIAPTKQFLEFLKTAEARKIFEKYGFAVR